LPHREEVEGFLDQVDSTVAAIDRALYTRILAAAGDRTTGFSNDVTATNICA
jgi:hypothetical protein